MAFYMGEATKSWEILRETPLPPVAISSCKLCVVRLGLIAGDEPRDRARSGKSTDMAPLVPYLDCAGR